MSNTQNVRFNLAKWLVSVATFLIIGIWIGAWWWASHAPQSLKGITEQPLADIFSSINALFAGLACAGVIVTIYLQMKEIKDTEEDIKATAEATARTAAAVQETADANEKMADASLKMATHYDERSVLDLFQIYCSDYFQSVKDSSMSVLIPCVASKMYFDFVVSRFFVAEQLPFPPDCWGRVSKASYCETFEKFVKEEQRNRYKLDELINFFTVLTGRKNSRLIIKRCDFSYSWWRPLFWMVASQQQKRYDAIPNIQKYATPLYFPEVVRELDEIYGYKPFSSDQEMWDFIIGHPKIISYGLDPEHHSNR